MDPIAEELSVERQNLDEIYRDIMTRKNAALAAKLDPIRARYKLDPKIIELTIELKLLQEEYAAKIEPLQQELARISEEIAKASDEAKAEVEKQFAKELESYEKMRKLEEEAYQRELMKRFNHSYPRLNKTPWTVDDSWMLKGPQTGVPLVIGTTSDHAEPTYTYACDTAICRADDSRDDMVVDGIKSKVMSLLSDKDVANEILNTVNKAIFSPQSEKLNG